MRSPARVARQARALAAVSREGARAYDCHPLTVARIARRVRRRQGFEYAEALRIGLLDPALSVAERSRFVGKHFLHEAQAPLNGDGLMPALTDDKSVFYRYCQALAVPVPALHAILYTRASSSSTTGRVLAGAADFAAFAHEDLPADFVVKPSHGFGGRGVRVVRRTGGSAFVSNGVPVTAVGLWDELSADPEFDIWIVQERLANHADLDDLGGAASLHTVRIVTLIGRDGSPRILFANLKLSLGGGASDNFQGGETGNAISVVDVADGRLSSLLLPEAGPAGLREVAESPETGVRVEGAVLPWWPEAVRLVLDASSHFLPYRALGWDVALTPDGPVVVEANTHWLPLPTASMHGVLEQMRREGSRT